MSRRRTKDHGSWDSWDQSIPLVFALALAAFFYVAGDYTMALCCAIAGTIATLLVVVAR